ncbi:MAG: hypothetical protein K6G81_08775 [Lachnospiraceae bacterium]|nr:hypothetical protein [Lachnospiraceae bacterium]
MEIILITAAILAALIIKGIYDKNMYEKKLVRNVRDSFGREPKKNITQARAQVLPYYAEHKEKSDCHVDRITRNDTDLDRIYDRLNSCKCAIGEEYLYYLLVNPSSSIEELNERERVISHLYNDREKRESLGVMLSRIGMLKNISAYEYMNRLKDITPDSNVMHIVQALSLAASIALIFFSPVYGIMLTIVMFFLNVITYFKRKTLIEGYFSIVFYILNTLDAAGKLLKTEDSELSVYYDRIKRAAGKFSKMRHNSVFLLSGAGAGPLQLIFDYVRMAFHIDLIKFNSICLFFAAHTDDFEKIFETVGFLDCMLAAASYRKLHEDGYSVPVLSSGDKRYIRALNLAHPLLNDPVTNDLDISRPVLLTGSNASGKSTFLKTVALNAILAQTIHTVLAQSYEAPVFHVMTSMALRDDIASGESYYIVEIKSLKRIIDEKGSVPVLCFIDEVLRGTNTVERIAASTQILRGLGDANALCLAATHDIELTHLLEDVYDNYHFEEQIEEDEIIFDYKLKKGRAASRNAISLLRIMGYPQDTVEAAAGMAERYVETGEWR